MENQSNRPDKILYVIRGVPWAEWTNSGFTMNLCRSLDAAGYLYGGIDCNASSGWELRGEWSWLRQIRRLKRRLGVRKKRWASELNGYVGRLLRRLPPETPVVYHYLLPEIDSSLRLRRFLFQDLSLYDAVQTGSYGHADLTSEQVEAKAEKIRKTYEQVEGILTYSTYAADSIARDFGFPRERISAIGCGPARSMSGTPTLERYQAGRILFTGRRWQQKGGPLLADAFSIVRNELPHCTLHVVGPSTLPEELERAEGICFHGYVDNSTVSRLFAQSSIFVMPAVCEAWGMVYTEAIDAGLPIAGFDAWALPDIVEHGRNGLLTSDMTARGLAEVMIEMLRSPEKMLQMARCGQERFHQMLQWEHVRDRLLAHVLPEVVANQEIRPLRQPLFENHSEGHHQL